VFGRRSVALLLLLVSVAAPQSLRVACPRVSACGVACCPCCDQQAGAASSHDPSPRLAGVVRGNGCRECVASPRTTPATLAFVPAEAPDVAALLPAGLALERPVTATTALVFFTRPQGPAPVRLVLSRGPPAPLS